MFGDTYFFECDFTPPPPKIDGRWWGRDTRRIILHHRPPSGSQYITLGWLPADKAESLVERLDKSVNRDFIGAFFHEMLLAFSEVGKLGDWIQGCRFDPQTGFHWRDGLYFQRLQDGSVHIRQGDKLAYRIPPTEWASIIAAVSAGGPTAIGYEAAKKLHIHD